MGLLDMVLPQGSEGGGLSNFLSQIMPGPSKNPYGGLLSDSAWERYRRDELGRGIGRLGDFLMRAAGGDFSGGKSDAGDERKRLLDAAKLRKFMEENQAKQQRAGNYSTLVGGYDPQSGINWNTGRVQGQTPTTGLASSGAVSGMPARGLLDSMGPSQQGSLLERTGAGRLGFSPAQQGLLRQIGPEKGFGLLAEKAFDAPSAPTVREFKEGDRIVTKRWDPVTRSWSQMGEAPRFKPSERGEPTLAQQSNNEEISQARRILDTLGLDKAEILRRTRKASNSGRVNPDYDSTIERVVRMATQRKTGSDPDYQRYFTTYLGGLEFSEPAGMRPLPPGVSAEEPSLFDRGLSFFGFGDDTNQPNSLVGTTTSERKTPRPVSPRVSRGRLGRGGRQAKNPPRLSNGGIDRSLLVVGQVYLHPVDGQTYRWTGTEFILAR